MDKHSYNEAMNAGTQAQLLFLNKQFYQTFGREFSSTRQRLQPGVQRVLDRLNGDESLLDLGCGNGEVARERMRRGQYGTYTGLDFSQPLLNVARQGWEDAPATFVRSDLSSAGWEKAVIGKMASPAGRFDVVVCFAVLHHIPGNDLRLAILQKVRNLLAPSGRFIHSEWQFMNSEKLKSRIQSWRAVGLTDGDVDPGDYLLDWRSGGQGLRYVHQFDEAELETLAGASGFRVGESFYSDGENDRLGLYQFWEAV
jgi:tRNA (uracil-5-)-methyltransferase TRM9